MTSTIPSSILNVQSIVLNDEVLFNNICTSSCMRSFETIFHKYYPFLCKTAFAMIRCEQQAEGIVSEVFSKIWRNRENIAPNVNVKYYLNSCVKNGTIDYLRKERKHRKVNPIDAHQQMIHSIQDSVNNEDEVSSSDLSLIIEKAISKLPPKAQEIFRLSRFEGLKYREIAEKLGISQKTVETQMTRSLVFLRVEILGKEDLIY